MRGTVQCRPSLDTPTADLAFCQPIFGSWVRIKVLQENLGHSILEMARRYVILTKRDLASGHQ